MFAISGVGGAILGVLISWSVTTVAVAPAWRPVVTIALVATLGTFSAAAISGAESASPATFDSLLYTAAFHIGAAILIAAFCFGAMSWLRGRGAGHVTFPPE